MFDTNFAIFGETNLPTYIADWDLKERITTIQPGDSVYLEWVIMAGELQQFGGDYVGRNGRDNHYGR